MKSTELAQRLYVSDATVRHWTGVFGEFLSDSAAPDKAGVTRELNKQDQLVIATVAALLGEGDGYDEIRVKLRKGERLENVPPASENELTRPDDDPPVSPERFRAALRRIADKDEEIASLRAQLAKRDGHERELYERIIKETEARAQLEGEIKALRNGKPRWPWQKG